MFTLAMAAHLQAQNRVVVQAAERENERKVKGIRPEANQETWARSTL